VIWRSVSSGVNLILESCFTFPCKSGILLTLGLEHWRASSDKYRKKSQQSSRNNAVSTEKPLSKTGTVLEECSKSYGMSFSFH
jgi:hypothetical protein